MVHVPTVASPDLIAWVGVRSEQQFSSRLLSDLRNNNKNEIKEMRERKKERKNRKPLMRDKTCIKALKKRKKTKSKSIREKQEGAGGPFPCFQLCLIAQVGVSSVDQ